MSSHRASAPPPLTINNSGDKGKDMKRSSTNGYFDDYRPSHSRNTSDASSFGSFSKPTSPTKQVHHGSPKPYSPTKNVYTHCGRHTDQFLFGGRSMSDLIRGVLPKKD